MHANKIKTAIPSKKDKQKTTRFKATATKLAKNQSRYFVLAGITMPTKNRKIELNEMETKHKIKAMIT